MSVNVTLIAKETEKLARRTFGAITVTRNTWTTQDTELTNLSNSKYEKNNKSTRP